MKRDRPRVFLDSNVLFSGFHSPSGPPGIIVRYFVEGKLEIVVSQQILEELVRTIKNKIPEVLPALREFLMNAPPDVVGDATPENVSRWAETIHVEDAGILAAAVAAQPDFLITGDKHFLDNLRVAKDSGLHICSPADFLEHFYQ